MHKLKWGLIGAGDIARRRVAPALRALANCELVAVSRGRAELAAAFASEFGARKWFADWRELAADGEVEAVYIATPVHVHAAQAIAALENGKHVLCEKPMALAADCDRMIAAARAAGRTLGVAYYRRFFPLVRRVKQILDAGEIGKPVLAQINAFEHFEPAADHPRRWLLEPEKSGGGPMMDFGCHRLELLVYLFGPAARLESLVANAVFGRAVEDTALAALQFESGVCANLTVTHAAFEPQDTLEIFGTKGTLSVPVLNQDQIIVRTAGGERRESHSKHENVHLPLIEDFTRAVLERREPQVTGETGRLIARLEDLIYGR